MAVYFTRSQDCSLAKWPCSRLVWSQHFIKVVTCHLIAEHISWASADGHTTSLSWRCFKTVWTMGVPEVWLLWKPHTAKKAAQMRSLQLVRWCSAVLQSSNCSNCGQANAATANISAVMMCLIVSPVDADCLSTSAGERQYTSCCTLLGLLRALYARLQTRPCIARQRQTGLPVESGIQK